MTKNLTVGLAELAIGGITNQTICDYKRKRREREKAIKRGKNGGEIELLSPCLWDLSQML